MHHPVGARVDERRDLGLIGAADTIAALIRELAEELMPLYVCRKWSGTPAAREGQRLAWVRPARLADYPMPPADEPLVVLLRDLL
jgi:hypothetical protein